MNITVISHAAGSPYHGPNMRWYGLGRALAACHAKVTIIGASWFHKYLSPPEFSGDQHEQLIDGVQYVWLKTERYQGRARQIYNQLEFAAKAYLYVRSLKTTPDVVVASSPHPFVIYPAHKLAIMHSIPLVFEVRDLWPLVIQDLSGASDWHPYIQLLSAAERFAVKKASMIVSVKPGDGDYFKKKYSLPEEKFFYSPNGYLDSKIPEDNKSTPSQPNGQTAHTNKKFIVGYVGAMSSYYGLQELLEAADLLKAHDDIEFRLFGGGEDEAKLRSFADERNLKSVSFRGLIPKSRVYSEIEKFDVCYVGLKDAAANQFGISCNKLYEYMHAGKPIIASYRTNYDPVQDAACGITVKPDSPEDISTAILKLEQDADLRNQMASNSRSYYSEHHDIRQIAKKYLSLFESLNAKNR